MAKKKTKKAANITKTAQSGQAAVSPDRSEELRLRLMEVQERQRQLLRGQEERLTEIWGEQKKKRVMGFPAAVAILAVFLMVFYVLVQEHCWFDFPLLILLVLVSAFLIGLTLYKNEKLCERINSMLEERRSNA